MPSLEEQLSRYGDVLDATAARAAHGDREIAMVTATPARRVTRAVGAAFVAVAVVLVITLIGVALGTRSTHQPSPTTTPIAGNTTTTNRASTTTALNSKTIAAAVEAQREAAAVAAAQRYGHAVGAAWIAAHGGQVVGLDSPVGAAITAGAYYVLSDVDPRDPAETLSRIDRKTLRVTSVSETGAAFIETVGDALYLVVEPGPFASRLQRLDPDSLQPQWSVQLTTGDNGGADPSLAPGNDSVWVSVANQLRQIDAQTGRVERSLPFSVPGANIGAAVALDPTGHVLYVAYGDSGGGTEPIEARNAGTGARLSYNPQGVGAVGDPQIVTTTAGAWVAYRTGMNGAATFFRAGDLKQTAALTVGGDTSFGGGVGLAAAGSTLWAGNPAFIACANATTGNAETELQPTAGVQQNLDAGPIAVDTGATVLGIGGTLGVFPARALCPDAR